jgi:hypothetical protein
VEVSEASCSSNRSILHNSVNGNNEGKAVSVYNTEAYGEVEGQLHSFLILTLNGQLHVSAVDTLEVGPRHRLSRTLGGLESKARRFGEEKNLSLLP